jgi:hypothetical protein
MKFLEFATRLAAVSLCVGITVGSTAARANDTYSLTKFTFCGIPNTRAGVSVTTSFTAFSNDGRANSGYYRCVYRYWTMAVSA